MKAWNAVKSLFSSAPAAPASAPTREELQARLDKVRYHIRENQREIHIGSRHSSGSGSNYRRLLQEEQELKAQLDAMP